MKEMQNSRFYTRWFETGIGWTKSFRDWLAELRQRNMAQSLDAGNAVAMLIAMMNGGSAEVAGIAKATAESAFENAEAWQQEVERLEALRRQAKDNVKKANALGESANLAAQWIPLGNVPSLELANAPVIEA